MFGESQFNIIIASQNGFLFFSSSLCPTLLSRKVGNTCAASFPPSTPPTPTPTAETSHKVKDELRSVLTEAPSSELQAAVWAFSPGMGFSVLTQAVGDCWLKQFRGGGIGGPGQQGKGREEY